ncbi:MAG: MaoC family dehydratase N-terminal domain-containing protein [Gammaproteobacteria bacterium]|nr:MaoC family dehydratase N-terminal domain-containing protein [Gammaproteobacteria bacterium]
MLDRLYFEDIAPGDAFIGATVHAERAQMLAFAREFDDQPMHLDASAAQAMGLDDVVASGAYNFSLNTKSLTAIWQRWHFLPSGLGIELSFTSPIYPGDELTTELTVTKTRLSTKPGRGWLDTDVVLRKADRTVGLEMTVSFLILCRPDR